MQLQSPLPPASMPLPPELTDPLEDTPIPSIKLPDPAICKTKLFGNVQIFADCEVADPRSCPYAISLGNGFLCGNPEWRKFLNGPAQE